MLPSALPKYAFPRQARLIKTDDFSSVFNFRKRVSGYYLIMHYKPNFSDRSRIGFVVSKKISKLSVRRNYIRRVLRELFRNQQCVIKNLDLIVRVQRNFTQKEYPLVSIEFLNLINKLGLKNTNLIGFNHETSIN